MKRQQKRKQKIVHQTICNQQNTKQSSNNKRMQEK